jgi:hypothetical protein
MELLYRGRYVEEDPARDEAAAPRIAPGRVTITQRLPARGALLFRVADPSTARALARALRRDSNGVAEGAEAALARTEGSTGTPLPDDARSRFEASLGTDLGDVRIHTGPGSADAAAGLGARAFAVGQDMHFGAGQYRPDDPFGMHLLAHEVAHTVQQRSGGAGPQRKATVSEPGDAAEVEADRAADAMVAGQRAEVSGGPTLAARANDPAAAGAAGGEQADAQQAKGKPAKVVNNIKEGKPGTIEYDAPTYFDLYTQAKAREDGGLEAGSCEISTIDQQYLPDPTGAFIVATFTATITTKLPSWKQYASASAEEKRKFDAWLASVKVHEARHAKIYTDGYAALKTEVVGPSAAECETQFKKVDTQVDKDQKAFDADKSKQPAPLAAPGGITKVPSSGVPQQPPAPGKKSADANPGEPSAGAAEPTG